MKRKIITLSGNIAAGKSEIAEVLAELLSMEVYSASQGYRSLARENNMTLVEFNEYTKDRPEYDKCIEEKTKEIANQKENLIIDARLGWYVVPNSFKVSVRSNIDIASKRIQNSKFLRGKEEDYKTIEEAKTAIKLREASERLRYKKQYNIDIDDDKNYDYIIDSSDISPKELANKIANEYKKWLKI